MTIAHFETETSMRMEVNSRHFGHATFHGADGWAAETDRGDSAAPGFTKPQIRAWLFEMAYKAVAIGEVA